jgi:hypothetical protein
VIAVSLNFLALAWILVLPVAALRRDLTAATPAQIDSARSDFVALGCVNPGTQQDAAKTPMIQNTTAAPIPRGRSVLWQASDGDRGGVTLGADLAPGDTVKGTGKPARVVYTCTAGFFAGAPDLMVSETRIEGITSATISNTNPWVDAGPSSVRFELLSCRNDSVTGVENVGPLVIMAGGKQAFVTSLRKPAKAGPTYFRIQVDFDNRVREANEKNNLWSNRSSCPR